MDSPLGMARSLFFTMVQESRAYLDVAKSALFAIAVQSGFCWLISRIFHVSRRAATDLALRDFDVGLEEVLMLRAQGDGSHDGVWMCWCDVDGMEVRDRKLLVGLERLCRFRVGEDSPLCV